MNAWFKNLRRVSLPLLAAVASALALPALAIKPQGVTDGEIALLPEYCIDTEGFIYGSVGNPGQSPRAPMWVERMGSTFKGMHHYCWGLVNLSRLLTGRANTQDKRYFAKQIVDEYFYVIRVATPDFILLPEVWTRIGEASILADDVGGALSAYAKARQIKPDYWPAYSQWAEFQLRYGKKEEAKALLRTGLQHAPDAKVLIDMYRKLGGDPSTVPRISVVEPPAASGDSSAPAASVAASGAASSSGR